MDLDVILKDIGPFGRYQIVNLSYLFFPVSFAAYFSMSYVFTAGDLDYRCMIPECERGNETQFAPAWLRYAAPGRGGDEVTSESAGGQHKCWRLKSKEIDSSLNCTEEMFTNETERCDLHVLMTKESTIVSDFQLFCEENQWKRSIIGTVNNIGQFVGMPLTGMYSDRWGRKNMVITGALLSTGLGIARSFSTSYPMFLTLELSDAIVASGIYGGGFILGVELVGPKKRELAGVIVASFYSLGEAIVGVTMWIVQDWRIMLRVLYLPGIFLILYIWLIPESLRWLLAQEKYKDLKNKINKVALTNKRTLSNENKIKLEGLCIEGKDANEKKRKKGSLEQRLDKQLKKVLSSRRMILRLLNCSFCWCTNAFVFFGLSLNSVAIAGNKYLNFILVSLIEIPGYILTWGILNLIGRRTALFSTLITSGISCILFNFIPNDLLNIKLILFLTGKMAITSSFNIIYVVTTEIFPTNMRHSLMGICSMFGRIGSIVAPLTPMLAGYIEPTLIFGSAALTAGILALFFPETVGTKLPDSLEEAEDLGKTKKAQLSEPERTNL